MGRDHFDYVFRAFRNVAEFETYLATLPSTVLAWASGVTIHHSYNPTLKQWHQSTPKAMLDGMAHYYQYTVDNGAGWTAGPHLFIADDGIYTMTPLSQPGVHATICNPHFVGCEVVGDYNEHYWSPATEYNVLGVTCALLRKEHVTNVSLDTVKGHRECNSPKTCPGTAISMTVVRQKVRDQMGIVPPPIPVQAMDRQVIGVDQSVTYNQWHQYILANGARLLEPELRFIYDKCVRYQVDAAFLIACWKQESFEDDLSTPAILAVLGGGTLQRQTHCPLNIKVAADDPRDKIQYKGSWWRVWETWQLGLDDAVNYFKQQHGAHDRLTVRDIITAYAPAFENDTATYIKNVFTRMDAMKALPK